MITARPCATFHKFGPRALTKISINPDTHVLFTHTDQVHVYKCTRMSLCRDTRMGPRSRADSRSHLAWASPAFSPSSALASTLPRFPKSSNFQTHFQLPPRHAPSATGPASVSFALAEMAGRGRAPLRSESLAGLRRRAHPRGPAPSAAGPASGGRAFGGAGAAVRL